MPATKKFLDGCMQHNSTPNFSKETASKLGGDFFKIGVVIFQIAPPGMDTTGDWIFQMVLWQDNRIVFPDQSILVICGMSERSS